MPDRDKVIRALEICSEVGDNAYCPQRCPYMQPGFICSGSNGLMKDALALLDTMHRAWETVKFSVLETAHNNAGENGNEDVYRILMFVAQLMDNQEKRVQE